jgi:hypothetical protein
MSVIAIERPTSTDTYRLFTWYGHGPHRQAPSFVRDWPRTHNDQLAGTKRTPEEVGEWLRSQLDARRDRLGEETYKRYYEYADRVQESFEAGSDSMCWAIWAADRSNMLSLAVVRDRANPGSPHQ